jgi:hypothetical protein
MMMPSDGVAKKVMTSTGNSSTSPCFDSSLSPMFLAADADRKFTMSACTASSFASALSQK